ncbi:MAG TPA: hypothetical protein VFR49_00655, partial [Solirubrobacteraceae bacterium]|nr:hypothetical protein [Solirubrobacteraceae bacterium]
PTVGAASPNQYEPTSTPGARERRPAREGASGPGYNVRPPKGRKAAPAAAPAAPAPAAAPAGDAPTTQVEDIKARFTGISKRPWET